VVNKDILDLEQWCQDSWGAPTRNPKKMFSSVTPQIRDQIEFGESSAALKLHIAEKLIRESCNHFGAFGESGDVSWFLHFFAREVCGTVRGFKGRRSQPLKSALLLTSLSEFSAALPPDRSDFDHILAGGSAMAAMYMLGHLEFLFRIRGRYLRRDGTVRGKIPQQLQKKAGIQPNRKQISQIYQTFILYLYRDRTPLGKRLRRLDRTLGIENRLEKIRNPVMHGELADPGVEAKFFGLLIAMFYYAENSKSG